ncbi:type III-B CRISPR module-associated Cmr3 family protein [Candidatus Methylocalor cossyra]|uniref:Type III-B CRISPR module-associated protein Cmr3 n=1 Tax=Candidatus Methylocalor cossyra TaxID=3108543 RepID=A0ABP1CA45_9GAMM
MNALLFDPLDSLFFRDGRPYHRDQSQADVVSQFPPFSPTLIGAARAALARALGWSGKGAWPSDITAMVGDGPCLKPLDFGGPYLLRDGQPVFPVPLLLLKTKAGGLIRLRPGAQPRQCDLGEAVRLPEPATKAEGAKEAEGWITLDGLAAVLAGGVPEADALLDDDALFLREARVGHQRNPDSRTIQDDNALYSPAHVRLQPKVTLALNVAGLPPKLPRVKASPLGGESRLAWIEWGEAPIGLPEPPKLAPDPDGKLRYSLVLVTPLDISELGPPRPNQPYAGLPGTLVSACLGRLQRVGGWNGRNADGGGAPLPLRPLLPAGSVLFLEADINALSDIEKLHGRKIGARTAWGFGQLVLGTW